MDAFSCYDSYMGIQAVMAEVKVNHHFGATM